MNTNGPPRSSQLNGQEAINCIDSTAIGAAGEAFH
jgi:hypothetical protein